MILRMRLLVISAALFAAGLGAGYLLFGGPAPAARSLGARTADIPAPPAPLPTSPPEQPPAAPAGVSREQLQSVMQGLSEEIRKRDARLHDLERELELLRKTLPPPAILQELRRATPQELLDVVEAVGRAGEEKLLTVPEEVKLRYAALLGLESTGAARVVERGKFDRIVNLRGGGAYFSFATRSNSYDEEPDVELQQGTYGTSFYGGTFGFLLDLGDYPVENVPADPAAVPSGLTAEQEAAWRFLASEVPADREGRRAWEQSGKALGLKDRVKAEPNHTYLLRAVLPGEHDILVAFRDAHRDDTGSSIVWREIRRWPAPR